MKKKYFIAAAAALAVTLASCGAIDDSGESDTGALTESAVSQSEQTLDNSGNDSSPAQRTESVSDADSQGSLADDESSVADGNDYIPVSGIFKESIDGVESNYVIINENASYLVGIGAVTGVPLGIDQTADTITINRGGVDDSEPADYTYDGNVLTFERNGSEYEWTKIEFIPISGTYYEVDSEGTYLNEWVFNGDGTGTISAYGSETGEAMTYAQTAETFEVTRNGGELASYSYTFDIFTLRLTADDGSEITLTAANS
ncbi:hypothetical protein [Ruminococcus sp. Marseille-P6503]|uniref:hypothetical protein n=1 Tax=Ruminococcus sp. Marseille-P6503 TaxID=2364796 RepID=UPI000F53E697|nr:hypothetical protein [Ruminococcus sp. Marseille-P6503]